MTEQTDLRELRERLDKMIESSEGSIEMNRGCNPYYANYANRMERDLATLREAADALEELEEVGRMALSVLDGLLGDSDLPDDDRPGMLAMRALSAALPAPAPAPEQGGG